MESAVNVLFILQEKEWGREGLYLHCEKGEAPIFLQIIRKRLVGWW